MTNFLPASSGYAASFTGTTTKGSKIITGVSSTSGLVVGQPIYSPGAYGYLYPPYVPLGALIVSVDSASQITISKAAIASGTGVSLKAASEKIDIIGGFAGGFSNNFMAVLTHTAKATPSAQGVPWAIEFMTDAANISTAAATVKIYSYRNGTTPNAYRIAIDDVYQSATPETYGEANEGYITIQFATAGIHKVRVEFAAGRPLQAIYVINGARIWKPEHANKVHACFFGDSWTNGGDTTDDWPAKNVAFRTAEALGWSNDMCAQGGTGYVADGGSNYAWQEPERQADVSGRDYDVIVFLGSITDNGSSAAAIQAAALTTWKGVRANAPSTPIIVFGCPTTVSVNQAVATVIEDALYAAFLQWADQNAHFIRVTTDPSGSWIDANNTGTYIGADNSHLTDIGVQYFASKMTQKIRSVLNLAVREIV
jgi:hypothetical protein